MHLATCSAKETEESCMSSVPWPMGGRIGKCILHGVIFPFLQKTAVTLNHDLHPKSLKNVDKLFQVTVSI